MVRRGVSEADPACRAAVDPAGTNSSQHWRCLLAEVAGRYIESRIFPIEQLWGVFGSFCLVNSVCEMTTMLSRFGRLRTIFLSVNIFISIDTLRFFDLRLPSR